MAFLHWINEHFNFFRNVHTLKNMEEKQIFSQVVLAQAKEPDLEFIFTEAKERLKSTMDIADNLTNRSITFFSLSVAALTTSIGYVATHFYCSANTFVLGAIGVMLWFVCSLLKKNIVPNEYFAIGTDPSGIVVDGMFTNLQDRTPRWHLLVHLINAYEVRITTNRGENEEKADNIEKAMFWIYMIPIAASASYLLFFLFIEPLG